MTVVGRIALLAGVLGLTGCSTDAPSTERSDAGDAGASVTVAPTPDGSLGAGVEDWRCTTTTETADSGPGSVICSCNKFVVPVDTTGAAAACADQPCCISDGPDACDCFSASYPEAMDCDGLVAQTNALETAQSLPPQAKRVDQCPP
ncbi:MAG TPA: hypothetical protein VH062_13105 [Polyangiaceae bacterium]|jgi:hypothetical protein|nr:hypothetical protein [Polyangiaceae bacterium]